jgi:hypothetical protein
MIERPRNQENLQTPDIENETNNQKQLRSKPSKGSLLDHNNDAKDSGTYLNTVLETIQLPACISDLNAGLTDMDRDALSHCRCFLQTPSKALTREQERKQTDRSLYFTKTFETGTKMQRKYWLTKVAESLKTNGRENLRGKRVQRRLHEVQVRKKERRMQERRLLWSLYRLFSHRAFRSPLGVLALR